MDFQIQKKCVSWFWEFGNLVLEMYWKCFGNMLRVACTNPGLIGAEKLCVMWSSGNKKHVCHIGIIYKIICKIGLQIGVELQ